MRRLSLSIAIAAACAAPSRAEPKPAAAPMDPGRVQACAQLKDLDRQEKAAMQTLQDRIKSLRGQVQDLEEQRKSQAETFRARRDALIAQLDPAAASARQSFEAQMKDLGEKEQQELKAVRDRYQAQRQGQKPPRPDLRCR